MATNKVIRGCVPILRYGIFTDFNLREDYVKYKNEITEILFYRLDDMVRCVDNDIYCVYGEIDQIQHVIV